MNGREVATHNTLISLREYVDIRFDAQEKATNQALAASDKAVNKAEIASEKRFDSVNEFRSALSDSARLLMPRSEAEQRLATIESSIREVKAAFEANNNKDEGRSLGFMKVVTIVSLASNAIVILYYLSRMHS